MLNTKYEGKLEKHYETAMYQVVSTVFRGLTGKKITGTSSFQSCAIPLYPYPRLTAI